MIDFSKINLFLGHNHTESSNQRLPDSTNKLRRMVEYGQELGLKGIAITDHESLSKHIQAMNIGKELKDSGSDFKVALGNEIYLVNSLEEVRDNYQSGVTKFPHFILIAKDKVGYEAIRRLSTEAWKSSFKGGIKRVPTTKENFAKIALDPKYRGHLIGATACLGGELGLEFNKLRGGDLEAKQRILKFVQAMKVCLGDDFYFEIQPSHTEEQIEYNKFLIELSKETDTKVIVSTDSHYLNPSMRPVHSAFLNSKDGDREVDSFYGSTYMMNAEEIWNYLKAYVSEEQFIDICENTMRIYDKIEYFNIFHKTIVPQINIPPFNPNNTLSSHIEYEYINIFMNSEYLIDKYLLFKLDEGMRTLGQKYNKENLERINIELEQLWKISEALESRMSGYYLLTQEVIDLSWLLSYVCPGRGSGVAFYCNYLLQITQLNPITHNLPYWRHVHQTKIELADKIIVCNC